MASIINAATSGGLITTADTSGILNIQTASTTAVTIDGSQNVGIGVTPNANWSTAFKALDIGFTGNSLVGFSASDVGILSGCYYQGGGSSGWKWSTTNSLGASYYEQYNGASIWHISAPTAHTAGTPVTFTQAMTLGSDGNMILGGTSPTTSSGYTSLSINNATNSGYLILQSNGTNKSDWYVSGGTIANLRGVGVPLVLAATGANYLSLETNGTERARINSSGRQYFFNAGSASTVADCIFNFAGTFGANRGISVNATDSATSMDAIYFTTQSTYRGAIVCSSGGTAYNTASDYRLKNTIAPMTGALARVAALKPCTYKWNADKADGEGFIAHELAEVCPSAVTGEKDAVDADGNIKPQGIDTSFLVATLTAAIQEQQALITQLQADVAALKGA